jgi:hypothetical protein
MKHQLLPAPAGLWCVYVHSPFAEDVAERSLEAEPVLFIEAEEVEDDEEEEPFAFMVYIPVIRYSSEYAITTPAALMYRLYWATSRGDALAQHVADANNLIPELTHDHSEGEPDVPRPMVRARPRSVN